MMRTLKSFSQSCYFLVLCLFSFHFAYGQSQENRPPILEGSFYPADPQQLSDQIDSFLEQSSGFIKSSNDISGIIVPHAGIIYSGQVAAYSYQAIRSNAYDTVILIGPSHRVPFAGASIWQKGDWQTPLGSVSIDEDLAQKIFSENEQLQFPSQPHLAEHSLEVELPFLQRTLQNFKIVPILLGDISLESSSILAKAIAKQMVQSKKRILIVASTDMSHYHRAQNAEPLDRATVDLIQAGDAAVLYENILNKKSELCGAGAVLTMLEIARVFNWRIEFLRYATSGNVTGDMSRVVGYGAFVNREEKQIVAGPSGEREKESNSEEFSMPEKNKLIQIARKSVEAGVRNQPPPILPALSQKLNEKRAAFVTLRKAGELRGCMGHLLPMESLALSVQNNAAAAAMQDPRFSPVTPEELSEIEIEISVLTLPEKIKNADLIEMGTHGVIVQRGRRSGVFLPQVAKETGWNKEKFLSELCSQKAGLTSDCWKDPETELLVFRAIDFAEEVIKK